MSGSEIKNFALLYEFDNRSPLFARIAFEKMAEENYEEAEGILTRGLNDFPNYPTAYFLLAEVKVRLGKQNEKNELLEKANTLLGDKRTQEYYDEKISELENKLKNFETPRSPEFITPEEPAVEPEQPVEQQQAVTEGQEEIKEETGEKVETGQEPEIPIEERLDELAKQLENAKISTQEQKESEELIEASDSEEEVSRFEDLDIASETLGMILESQGNYKEAIEVYKKLIELEPDKKEIYELKIQELTEHLSEENE